VRAQLPWAGLGELAPDALAAAADLPPI
jgi:hypothetical protein